MDNTSIGWKIKLTVHNTQKGWKQFCSILSVTRIISTQYLNWRPSEQGYLSMNYCSAWNISRP